MINQDYILLIFNCVKYRFKAVRQKETWLKDLPGLQNKLIYYHVIGDPKLEIESGYLFDEDERILWLRVDDDYNSLPKRLSTHTVRFLKPTISNTFSRQMTTKY